MTRSQMIETVARKTGFTEAQVETTMDAMFDQIADCLRSEHSLANIPLVDIATLYRGK